MKAPKEVNQQTQSLLFKVPREVRDKFYGMVYQDALLPVDVAAAFHRAGDTEPNSHHRADARPSTALILTW